MKSRSARYGLVLAAALLHQRLTVWDSITYTDDSRGGKGRQIVNHWGNNNRSLGPRETLTRMLVLSLSGYSVFGVACSDSQGRGRDLGRVTRHSTMKTRANNYSLYAKQTGNPFPVFIFLFVYFSTSCTKCRHCLKHKFSLNCEWKGNACSWQLIKAF